MEWLHIVGLFLGGVLAASGFIIKKKPEAKELIAKVAPYQGGIGVGLLVLGVLNLLDGALKGGLAMMDFSALLGITVLGVVISEVVLGFLLGFGLIAQWIPGEGAAEKKGLEIQAKLMSVQVPFGIAGIVFSILMLLYRLRILGA